MIGDAGTSPPGDAIGFRTRWAHILPSIFIVYTISYLDRVNIGTALPSITKELHITPTEAGFIGGVFFWGYLVSFLIGGWLSNKFGAKRVTLICLVGWGIFAIASGFATDFVSLAIVRVLLGFAEGPIWSSMSTILSQWFLKAERARAFSTWNISLPVGALLSGPISGLVIAHYDWHVMLILEGLPALLYAFVWWWFIPEGPEDARWLSSEERDELNRGLAKEAADFDATVGKVDLRGILLHGGVWLLLVAKTFNNMVAYGFTLWLPTAIKDASSLGIGSVGMLSALPYLASIVGVWAVGVSADRFRERRLHGAIPMITLAALLFASSHVSAHSFVVMMMLLTLSGFVMFMTLPMITVMYTDLLPRRQAIVAIAISGGIANLVGGFVGPVVVGWIKTLTGDVSLGFTFLSAVGFTGGILMLLVKMPGSGPAQRREIETTAIDGAGAVASK